MENESRGRRGAHGERYLEESTEEILGELVGLGIGHEEEDEGRDERVLGFQSEVERHF